MASSGPEKKQDAAAPDASAYGTLGRCSLDLIKSAVKFLDLPSFGNATAISKAWTLFRRDRALVTFVWTENYLTGLVDLLGRDENKLPTRIRVLRHIQGFLAEQHTEIKKLAKLPALPITVRWPITDASNNPHLVAALRARFNTLPRGLSFPNNGLAAPFNPLAVPDLEPGSALNLREHRGAPYTSGIACQRCHQWAARGRTLFYCSSCIAELFAEKNIMGGNKVIVDELKHLPDFAAGRLASTQQRQRVMKCALAKEFIMEAKGQIEAVATMEWLASTGEKESIIEFLSNLLGVSYALANTLLWIVRRKCPQFYGPRPGAGTGLDNDFIGAILPRIVDPWAESEPGNKLSWEGLDQEAGCLQNEIMIKLVKMFDKMPLEHVKLIWNNAQYRHELRKTILGVRLRG